MRVLCRCVSEYEEVEEEEEEMSGVSTCSCRVIVVGE
jgi:hypothetical protein